MRFLTVVAALALVPVAAAAQQSRPATPDPSARPLEHTFSGDAPDSLALSIDPARVYELTVSPARGEPSLRPAARYGNAALLVPVRDRSDPSRAVYQVYAGDRGEHFLRLAGLSPADTVHVSVWGDSGETAALAVRHREHLRRRWTIALVGSGGAAGRFPIDAAATTSSGFVGGGIVIGNTVSRFAVQLGAAHQSTSAARVALT